MWIWRDQATRPCRRLTPAAPPVPPPPPPQLLKAEAISARSEHRSCPERTFVSMGTLLRVLRPLPVWQHARNRVAPAPSPAAPACRPPVISSDDRSRPAPARASHITTTTRRRCRHSAPCHAGHHPVDVCTRSRRRQRVSVRRTTPTIGARAPAALGHLRIGNRMTPD